MPKIFFPSQAREFILTANLILYRKTRKENSNSAIHNSKSACGDKKSAKTRYFTCNYSRLRRSKPTHNHSKNLHSPLWASHHLNYFFSPKQPVKTSPKSTSPLKNGPNTHFLYFFLALRLKLSPPNFTGLCPDPRRS